MSAASKVPAQGNKRKEPPGAASHAKFQHKNKRAKFDQARKILTQTSGKALSQIGELDVAAFVKAREFEITAMETSMVESKNVLSARAFQQVPNALRRRTASHNVKKVPKRLRNRAAREMKEDNTPTTKHRRQKATPRMHLRLDTAKKLEKLHARQKKKGEATKSSEHQSDQKDADKLAIPSTSVPQKKKNTLSKSGQPPPKFRKRQKNKAWLPTHIFHAKRAHMTEPKHPLWRFAIPLSPTEKSFRKTHRAGSLRGCVAWDISYISTIGLEGVDASLLGLFRGLGIDEEALSGKTGSRWRRGTRSWHGWVRERDDERRWIAKVGIVWCIGSVSVGISQDPVSEHKKNKRKCILRTHPSAFLQLWTEMLKVAKMQRPPVMVEDLRFEIGSIELIGPGSTEALVAALKPIIQSSNSSEGETVSETWASLGSVTNPSSLPANAFLGFDVQDPRLRYPPRTIEQPKSECPDDELLQTLAQWPPDSTETPSLIFDRTSRLTASRSLPSQKAINRRKGDAPPGEYPSLVPNDPQIPVLLMASRCSTNGAQGSWTLLLPWKCVLPVWYYMMHYPMSTGGSLRFGGLDETRQIAFEQGDPWFPGDFPGTQAGWDWELTERAKRKADWEKRPKGKRVAWDSLDLGKGKKGEIGVGWACDWELLVAPVRTSDPAKAPDLAAKDLNTKAAEESKAQNPVSGTSEAAEKINPPLRVRHIPLPYSSNLLASSDPSTVPAGAVSTIQLHLLSRGHPVTCARIYRLPTSDLQLCTQWLALASSAIHPRNNNSRSVNPRTKTNERRQVLSSLPQNESHPLRTQQLALSLLPPLESGNNKDGPIQPGDPEYPCIPDKEDLIGFVTTGNFDLGQGKESAIGSISIAKVLVHQRSTASATADKAVEEEPGINQDEEARKSMEELKKTLGKKLVQRLCIVRNTGESFGRLARWELV
ncbi:MAG: hypothetical protein Q9220_000068 [cf. Caloplaca sp. 1 TL-2023]